MTQTLDYFRVDPAGNITGFVIIDKCPDLEKRSEISDYIMNKVDKSVEQVGFISKDATGNLRMDMMGGEFCGNASRSFALYCADIMGINGIESLNVSVSGSKEKVEVSVDTIKRKSEIELSPAIKTEYLDFNEGRYFTVFLEGITHVIVNDKKPDRLTAKNLIAQIKNIYEEEAYGVMFLDEENFKMTPFVYVVATDTLVPESSCGSGTVSCGYYFNRLSKENCLNLAKNSDKINRKSKCNTDVLQTKNDFKITLEQPGGSLELIKIIRGEKVSYKIGGKVLFGEKQKINFYDNI